MKNILFIFFGLISRPLQKLDNTRSNQARLISSFLVLVICLQIFHLIDEIINGKDPGLEYFIGILFITVAYFLTRTSYFQIGALLWGITNTTVSWIVILKTQDINTIPTQIPFLIFSLMIPALVVKPIYIVIIGMINVLVVLTIPFFSIFNTVSYAFLTTEILFTIISSLFFILILYYREYTDRIKNSELMESKKQIQDLLESTSEAIIGIDLEGNCSFCNAAAQNILGFANQNEILGNNFRKLIHHTDVHGKAVTQENCRIFDSFKGKHVQVSDEIFWKKNGSFFPVEYNSSPVYRSGNITGAVISFFDISERLKIENALRESEERLKEAHQIAHIGNWDWNIKTGSLYWSDEIYRIFGRIPQEFPATYAAFLETIHPDDRDNVTAAVDDAVRNKSQYSINHRIVLPDGEIRIVHEEGKVYFDTATDKPMRMIGAVQDITQLKNTEAKLIQWQKIIEETNQNLNRRVEEEVQNNRKKDLILIQQSRLADMGEMISHIAHQWRQPLNALSLLLSNIKFSFLTGELTEESLEETLNRANNYMSKMSTTIDDFRNYFKPNKEISEFLISEAVESTMSLVAATLKDASISLETSLSKNLMVSGFPNEFSQVILNLLNNARDAITENKISNGMIKIQAFAEGEKIFVIIEDNGGGIPANIIDDIFKPYFTTKEEGRGTGIGLYMSKNIITDHMAGSITAESTRTGAVFTIELPAYKNAKK